MSAPRRLVLKVGSRLLTGGTRAIVPERIARFVDAVARHSETQTVLVSSGAIAAGYAALGLQRPPTTIRERQAAAAVGQTRLMRLWAEGFHARGLEVAQVLLTNDVVQNRQRYVNARNTFSVLFDAGVVPVVNENDTVSVDEIKVGDNDNLAAHTAALVDAELLVLLTDVDGVYDADPASNPDARVIPRAASADELRPHTFGKKAAESVGGMHTKLEAAEKAAAFGIPTVIANGDDAAALDAVYAGEPTGTLVEGSERPLRAYHHWIATQTRMPGRLVVDDGAVTALRRGGTSLLPRGVVGVEGRFDPGDVVAVVDARGVEHARGVVAYGHQEVARIVGLPSSEIEEVLGYSAGDEVIHADRIVILEGA